MLPFLKPKQQSTPTVVIQDRRSDKPSEPNEHAPGLMAAAKDLITAVHARDESGVAAAFKAAFELLELEPHDEEISPESEQE